ncbi:hemagglutinin/amebocyte aggregation factor-like [Mytilus trossulus]|uniref:hemagglutinin/amebocyte aggregation factor-like n=1 Tax=Mytilus trossulus TaxID=6551 RepID=UPI0030079D72
MEILIPLFIIIFTLHSANGYNWANTYDKPFEFVCPAGTAISEIHSEHDNHHEDRIFAFQCRVTEIKQHTLCHWSSYANDFDQFFSYQCANHGFITGIQSYHDNGHEDRKFKFHCCEIQEMDLSECYYTNPNPFDATFTTTVPENLVFRGVTSSHNNHHEDREFSWEVCRLKNRYE